MHEIPKARSRQAARVILRMLHNKPNLGTSDERITEVLYACRSVTRALHLLVADWRRRSYRPRAGAGLRICIELDIHISWQQ